eukprot:1901679-Amphidinium_carterae.1
MDLSFDLPPVLAFLAHCPKLLQLHEQQHLLLSQGAPALHWMELAPSRAKAHARRPALRRLPRIPRLTLPDPGFIRFLILSNHEVGWVAIVDTHLREAC